MNTRRGFIKIGMAVVGAFTLAKYAEPLIEVSDLHQWIEDKGDFYIIRVPDFKTFAKETLNKPTIFLLGEQATVRDVEIFGYANVYAPKGGTITQSRIDGSKMITEVERPLLTLKGERIFVTDSNFVGSPTTPSAIYIDKPQKPLINLGFYS